MSDRTPAAFLTSLGLHGLVVGLFFFVAYSANDRGKPATQIFELVAGEGDNFAATEAPALGSLTGIKLNLPSPPAPKLHPVEPDVVHPEPAPEPVPVAPPAPEPKPKPVPEAAKKNAETAPAPKSAATKTKTLAEQMRWEAIKAESKVKQQLAREKAAEQKRLEKERLEQARLASAAAKAPQVDAKGIAKGVLGGSTANTEGGAGGKALARSDGPVLEAYFGMLRERLFKALEKPPGLSDEFVAEAEFRLNSDGSITGAKIVSKSGSAEFDRSVLDAFARVRMPPRPDGKSSVQSMRFLAKALE